MTYERGAKTPRSNLGVADHAVRSLSAYSDGEMRREMRCASRSSSHAGASLSLCVRAVLVRAVCTTVANEAHHTSPTPGTPGGHIHSPQTPLKNSRTPEATRRAHKESHIRKPIAGHSHSLALIARCYLARPLHCPTVYSSRPHSRADACSLHATPPRTAACGLLDHHTTAVASHLPSAMPLTGSSAQRPSFALNYSMEAVHDLRRSVIR